MSRISVIIPVYNAEKYLPKCIESVIGQTYKNWELLLIDDGSEDSSGNMCDHYAEHDLRIRVIHNQNQGPAASRKCGIMHAKGDLVMFMDSDDWVDEKILEILYQEMQESNADIVTCTYKDIYAGGKIIVHQPFKEKSIECKSFAECVYQIHGTRYLMAGPWAKLYQKSCFANVDYREHVTIGEDYSMVLQVVKNTSKVRMIKDTLYNRRMYGGNISRSGYSERHRQALDNYLAIRRGLMAAFPEYSNEILGYHIEYEMAVITAMCRNRNFDREVIQKLRDDLSLNMKEIVWKCKIPMYMKICALMIAYAPKIFCACFILLHKWTGR